MIPADLEWINVAGLRMDQQLGRPVLIEFWDFCRANSLRTLGYVRGWHERYAQAGLRVISVHTGGYPPSQDPEHVRAAVARLGIEHPVLIDASFALWQEYGNEAWPARYLFDQRLRLFSMHYGEGAYDETQDEICELLGIDAEPLDRASAPRTCPARGRTPDAPSSPAHGQAPTRPARVWAVLEPAPDVPPRRSRPTAARSRFRTRAAMRWSSTSTMRRACSSSSVGDTA